MIGTFWAVVLNGNSQEEYVCLKHVMFLCHIKLYMKEFQIETIISMVAQMAELHVA